MVGAGTSGDIVGRDDRWSESIAVGSEGFVEQVRIELGFRDQHRQDGLYALQEPMPPYGDHFDKAEMWLLGQITPFPGKQILKQQTLSLVRPQFLSG
jgi:hypothetical protein